MKHIYHNARVYTQGALREGLCVITDDEIILSVEPFTPAVASMPDAELRDCRGGYIIPGAIDTHVHFREPGLTEKADIASESLAARAGGVTSFTDMPNTKPPTLSMEAVDEKLRRAAESSAVNYGFFIGASNDNIDRILDADFSRVAGIKLFMGSSTGNMLVDREVALDRLFRLSPTVVAVHAEDENIIAAARERLRAEHPDGIPVELHPEVRPREACIAATRRALALAERYGTHLHICHISTADELRLIADAKARGVNVTAETCPQYLLFDRNDLLTLGSRVKCNPSVKEASDRIALIRELRPGGVIDTIATDHAPHLLAQKEGDALTAASGMPMVQWALPAMLDLITSDPDAEGWLTVERVVELMCVNPARIFAIERRGRIQPGYYADLVLAERLPLPGVRITDEDVVSRCGWTPLAGRSLQWRVETLQCTRMPLKFNNSL